jgi:hypothetical protein
VSVADFLRLPLGVRVLVGVMFWPIIWAGALAIAALAGDLIRPSSEEYAYDAKRRHAARHR